jgi:predicted amidohydrolase YtcJ
VGFRRVDAECLRSTHSLSLTYSWSAIHDFKKDTNGRGADCAYYKEPHTVLAPQERVSVEAAIRSVTSNAAWQCPSDHEIGSLEPGKLADFVVLQDDPRLVEPSEISDIRVLETWIDGDQVYIS